MGLFKKNDAKEGQRPPDFSNVRSGGSSSAPGTPPGSDPESAAPGTHARMYTVVKGDSLFKIAKKEYGHESAWHRIFDANRDQIEDPDLIYPGQHLRIP